MGYVANSAQGAEIASKLPLFAAVDPRLLSEIGPALGVHVYGAGDRLFAQGDQADELVVILNGHVAIFARTRAAPREDSFLVVRSIGEVVGEQAFIENIPRTATAIAQDTVRALLVPREAMARLMTDVEFMRRLLEVVSRKLSDATEARAFRYRNEALLFGEFRAHVSAEVEQDLLHRGGKYGEPRRQKATVMFSDIRNFTATSSILEPLTLASELSNYLDHVVEVVHGHGGMVDKFIGDSVMAVWGEFLPGSEGSAERSVACAQEIVRTASEFSFGDAPIRVGVGLEAGEVFVGNIGGEGKRQFTVLGSVVNLAARYEGETKELGIPIVLGSGLYADLPQSRRLELSEYVREIRGAGTRIVYGFRVLPAEIGVKEEVQ